MLEAVGLSSLERSTTPSPRGAASARRSSCRRRSTSRRSCGTSRSWPRRTARAAMLSLPRRGRVRPPLPARGRSAPAAQRVLHGLHALPARGRAGHAAGDLRVPDDRERDPRPARRERVDVRRRERHRRSGAHGAAAHGARAHGAVRGPASALRSARSRPTWATRARGVSRSPPWRSPEKRRPRRGGADRRDHGRDGVRGRGLPEFLRLHRGSARLAEAAHAKGALLVTVDARSLRPRAARAARRARRGHRRREGSAPRPAAAVRRPGCGPVRLPQRSQIPPADPGAHRR
jgi:hypothetical protein